MCLRLQVTTKRSRTGLDSCTSPPTWERAFLYKRQARRATTEVRRSRLTTLHFTPPYSTYGKVTGIVIGSSHYNHSSSASSSSILSCLELVQADGTQLQHPQHRPHAPGFSGSTRQCAIPSAHTASCHGSQVLCNRARVDERWYNKRRDQEVKSAVSKSSSASSTSRSNLPAR